MRTGEALIPAEGIDPDVPDLFMTCRSCHDDVLVSTDTRRFTEYGVGPRVAYYSLEPSKPPKLAGVSDGRAETFECIRCHAAAWARRNGYAE